MLWQWSVQDTSEEDAKYFHTRQSLKKSTQFFPRLIWLLTLKEPLKGFNLIQLCVFLLLIEKSKYFWNFTKLFCWFLNSERKLNLN